KLRNGGRASREAAAPLQEPPARSSQRLARRLPFKSRARTGVCSRGCRRRGTSVGCARRDFRKHAGTADTDGGRSRYATGPDRQTGGRVSEQRTWRDQRRVPPSGRQHRLDRSGAAEALKQDVPTLETTAVGRSWISQTSW